jgi:hypothetical protein
MMDILSEMNLEETDDKQSLVRAHMTVGVAGERLTHSRRPG